MKINKTIHTQIRQFFFLAPAIIVFLALLFQVLVSYTTSVLETLVGASSGLTDPIVAKRLWELPPERMIVNVAQAHEIDPNQFLKIAKCENGTHEADRKNYAWPQISASGMFMFTDSTWIATRKQMGFPDPNLTLKHDSVENTKTAAWKIANGGIGAWSSSQHCWQS